MQHFFLSSFLNCQLDICVIEMLFIASLATESSERARPCPAETQDCLLLDAAHSTRAGYCSGDRNPQVEPSQSNSLLWSFELSDTETAIRRQRTLRVWLHRLSRSRAVMGSWGWLERKGRQGATGQQKWAALKHGETGLTVRLSGDGACEACLYFPSFPLGSSCILRCTVK